jgi:hypothetical protein
VRENRTHGSIGGRWGGDAHGETETAPPGKPDGLSPSDLQASPNQWPTSPGRVSKLRSQRRSRGFKSHQRKSANDDRAAQFGKLPDHFGWNMAVEDLENGSPARSASAVQSAQAVTRRGSGE